MLDLKPRITVAIHSGLQSAHGKAEEARVRQGSEVLLAVVGVDKKG